MAQSFAEFKSGVSETDPTTVSPRNKKTSFRNFKTTYGRKDEDEEEEKAIPAFDVSSFGLTDALGSTKDTSPQTTDQNIFRDTKKAAKGTFSAFKALAGATKEGDAFKEGFNIGMLQSAGSIETSLSRVFNKLAEEKPRETVTLKSGREIEVGSLPRGKHIPQFFESVSDKLAERASKDFKLSESLSATVENPESFTQAIQDPEFIARGVGQNLPNLLAAFGVGAGTLAVTKNPAATLSTTFGTTATLEFGFAYEDAKSFGLSDEDAENAALTVGVANGILDTLPIGRALKNMPAGDQIKNNMLRSISRDITGQMVTEAGTESLQEIVGNAVAMSYNENQELLEGVPEAMYFGSLLGGGTTLATHIGAGGVRGLETESIFDDEGNVKPEYADLYEAAKEAKSAEDFARQNTDAFHGSYAKIEEFEDGFFGETTANNEQEVFYMTYSEPHAIEYSREAVARRNEGEFYEKFEDTLSSEEIHEKLYEDAAQNIETNPVYVNVKNPAIKDWEGESLAGRWDEAYEFIEEAKLEGHDGVIFKNISDDINEASIEPQDEVIAFKKEQILTEKMLKDVFNEIQEKEGKVVAPEETKNQEETVEFIPVEEAVEEFDRAEFEVLTEMELAEAGDKFTDDQGNFHVKQSTFPDWIPADVSNVQSVTKKVNGVPVLNKDGSERRVRKRVVTERGLRSSKLIAQVIEHFNNGTLPPKNATQQHRLLEIVQEEIASRISESAKDTVALQQIASQSPIKAGIVKKAKAAPSARRVLGIEQAPIIKARETTLLKQRMRALAQGSRFGLKEGRRLQAEIDKVKNDTKLSDFKRKEELKRLRQRIKDRESFTNRGQREATASTKRQIKTIQKRLVGIIEQSNLDKKDQNKFMKLVTNIQTTEQLQKALPEIEFRILTLGAKSDIRQYIAKIKKLLKATKIRKQSGKPVGKFTADVQQVLDDVKKYVKMSREEGAELIVKNLEPYTTTDTFPPDAIVRENVLIDTFAGLNTKPVQDLKKAADFIEYIIETGKVAAELKKFNRSELMDRQKAKVIDTLTGGEGIPDTVKTTGIKKTDAATRKEMITNYFGSIGKSIVGWKDVLDMLSVKDKDSDPFRSFISRWGDVINEQREERGGLYDQTENVRDIVRRVYDIEGDRQVIKKLAELTKEENLGTFKNADGKEVELLFTRDEMIKRYMEMQDPSLAETIEEGMGYTQEIKDAITNELTTQDIAFAEAQLNFYRNYYQSVNNVYREMYGVNLPKNEFYSPIRREGVAETVTGAGDFLQDITSRASIAGSSLKSRVKNVHPLRKQGSTSVMEQHITQMEHFKAWAEKLRDLQTVFNDPQVRTAMELNHGRDIIGVVDGFLQDMARGSDARAFRTAALDKMRARFSRAVLSVKPSIFVKQLTSFLAYADSMPSGNFTKYFVEFWKAPVENGKFLLENSTMLKTRGQNINRDLAVALKSDEYNFFREKSSFLNSLTLNIKAGDQGAIIAGGYPVYKHHYNEAIKAGEAYKNAIMNGKSEAEAKAIQEAEAQKIGIEEFEKVTESTQQSAELSEQSQFQRGGSIAKLFTMFLSTPNQYFRKELGAIRNLIAGRGSVQQHAKTIFIFHFMLPMIFQYVSDFFRFNKEEQMRAAMLGSLNGIFIVGDGLDYLLRKALGQRTFSSEISLYSIANDMGKGIDLLLKDPDEVDTDDVIRGIRGFAGATGSLTGTPLKQVVDTGVAVNEVLEGEYERGLGQFLGWSPYIVDQALSEDEAESGDKKKKKKQKSTTEKKKKKKKE